MNTRDEASFETFYRRHRDWSRVLVRRMLSGTDIDWEDHWNEAWGKFGKSYLDPTFGFKVSPEAYLRSCLANEAMSTLRVYQRTHRPLLLGDREELLTADMGTADETVVDLVDWLRTRPTRSADRQHPALAAALARLSPMQRAVIVFWCWKEPPATTKEISDALSISESTVKTHKKRALDNLRRSLNPDSLNAQEAGKEIT
jgi:RNA polymerase sigma factor (sigma-70 family)